MFGKRADLIVRSYWIFYDAEIWKAINALVHIILLIYGRFITFTFQVLNDTRKVNDFKTMKDIKSVCFKKYFDDEHYC